MICAAWLSAAELDALVLRQDWAAVDAALPCVWELLAPADAALLHRAMGVRAVKAGSAVAAVGVFRAARRLQPDESPPPEAKALWDAAGLASPGGELHFRSPRDCDLFVDGVETATAREGESAVVQCIDDDGRVRLTTWMDVATVKRVGTGGGVPQARSPEPKRGLGLRAKADPVLLVTGAVLLGASATMLGLSTAWNHDYYDISEPLSEDELEQLRDRTNATWVGFAVTGVAGAGLVSGAVFTLRW